MESSQSDLDRLLITEHTRKTAELAYGQNPLDADNLTKWGGALLELAGLQSPAESVEYCEAAKSKLEEALRIDPEKHETLWCLGNAYTAHGFYTKEHVTALEHFAKATHYYQEAVTKEPTNELYRKSLDLSFHAPALHVELSKEWEAKTKEKASLGKKKKKTKIMESKSTIGLSWAPKLPPMLTDVKKSIEKVKVDSISKHKDGLIDGLYVPPRDPKKFNKLMQKNLKDTAGKSWFDMPAPTITPELKLDLEVLKLRGNIDPKRFYKNKAEKSKELPKYFQVGTVMEPASEYYSGRLTKRQRKTSIAEDLVADDPTPGSRELGRETRNGIRNRALTIKEENRPAGNPKWKNKGAQTWKRAKERRA